MILEGDQDAGRIEELLGRYVERRLRDGTALAPEELCRDEPELLGPLREHIRDYELLNRALAPPPSLKPGRMLLHYRVAERLGAGGMGEVYAAEDTKLRRRVALKLLRVDQGIDGERLARFLHEARVVASLNHPNIVTIFAVEQTEDFSFLAMELVEGQTLAELIPDGGLDVQRILDVAGPLADALAAAHQRGIVHRDLKPANVMVDGDRRVKVLDFGLAKLRAGAGGDSGPHPSTVAGRVLGTLPYMSPEQVRGAAVDARTDVFAFGIVLYEMAGGRRPFRGRSDAELAASILRDTPAPLSDLRRDLPRDLDRIVRRCLEKEKERRFTSALEVRAALDRLGREATAAETLLRPWGDGGDEARLYIASASEDLAAYRAAACEVATELGFEPVTGDGLGVVERGRQVAAADALLAIVGWSRGPVPGPEVGGDALRSYAQWEVAHAFRRARPVLVLMANDGWPEEHRDSETGVRALVHDFRGELDLLAVPFDEEPLEAGSPAPLPGFRARLAEVLERFRGGRTAPSDSSARTGDEDLELRLWPAPELPERPYPVLLPYSHPDLLGGRDRELAELREALRLPVPIVGLYAPSGAGKSSFLAGGLVAALRAEGRPVAVDRHPDEPGLAGRLLGDLLTGEGGDEAFVHRLRLVRRLAAAPAVLVLDQFENLLRRRGAGSSDARRLRAQVGALLAATLQRQPGLEGPLCRWILAYRQEYHGLVTSWLGDVLREARSEGLAVDSLPHDLSGPERFQAWPLPPLGTPAPGCANRAGEAARLFQEAIEKPLGLRRTDGTPQYPWRFAGDGAARLARAFGEARVAHPQAPLAPELQVVLAHLLEQAAEPGDSAIAVVEVGDAPGALIGEVLDEHLVRALDAAFPAGRTAGVSEGRTRALLALRELADAGGRRGGGLPAAALAEAIGAHGEDVLEKLATPATRLVVKEENGDSWRYVLAHDRLAEVVVRLVDAEGRYGRLGVDADLVALRRFVVLNTELYLAGETAQATRVPARHFRPVEEHAGVLLWGEDRRRWWAACLKRRRSDRRRAMTWRAVAALILLLVTAGAWTWADRRAQRQALYEQIARGEPAAALAAFGRLAAGPDADTGELRSRLRRRANAMDVLESGLAGVGDESRSAVVLRAVEVALPLVDATPEDPVLIANLVWALDYAPGRHPVHAARAQVLRDRVLEPLRRIRPPPAPAAADPDWADVPGGTFWMGSGPGEVPEDDEAMANSLRESPRHEVTISPFRMLTHEVTNQEYRRLVPDHEGVDDLPAGWIEWWEAYTYAAWLGGRLPTEAEWEYAARAGCLYAYCSRDGLETTVDEVAWTVRNSPETERPVMQLEPNPWGLFDMYGNFSEWTTDWLGEYPSVRQRDPWGPATGMGRVVRGGRFWASSHNARAAYRRGMPPGSLVGMEIGIRVVLPAAASGR